MTIVFRKYFLKVNRQEEEQLDQSTEQADDYEHCMSINDEWNKAIAVQREARLAEAKKITMLNISEKIEEKKKRDEERLKEIDAEVMEVIKIAPTFITEANIDQAIADALENVVDYNKALDINGEWYTDKSGLPQPQKPLKKYDQQLKVEQ